MDAFRWKDENFIHKILGNRLFIWKVVSKIGNFVLALLILTIDFVTCQFRQRSIAPIKTWQQSNWFQVNKPAEGKILSYLTLGQNAISKFLL